MFQPSVTVGNSVVALQKEDSQTSQGLQAE